VRNLVNSLVAKVLEEKLSGTGWMDLNDDTLKNLQTGILKDSGDFQQTHRGLLAVALTRLVPQFTVALEAAKALKAKPWMCFTASPIIPPTERDRSNAVARGSRNGFLRLVMPTSMLLDVLRGDDVNLDHWKRTGNFLLTAEAFEFIRIGINDTSVRVMQVSEDAHINLVQPFMPSGTTSLEINAFDVGELDLLESGKACSFLLHPARKVRIESTDQTGLDEVVQHWSNFLLAERSMALRALERRKDCCLRLPGWNTKGLPKKGSEMPTAIWARFYRPNNDKKRKGQEPDQRQWGHSSWWSMCDQYGWHRLSHGWSQPGSGSGASSSSSTWPGPRYFNYQ